MERDEGKSGVRQFIPGVSGARVAISNERSKGLRFLSCPDVFANEAKKVVPRNHPTDILCNVIPAIDRTQRLNIRLDDSIAGIICFVKLLRIVQVKVCVWILESLYAKNYESFVSCTNRGFTERIFINVTF